MEVIYLYVLFALTTAIAAQYELVSPVMRQLCKDVPEDHLVQSKWVTSITLFLMNILFAPVIIIPTITPSASEWYKDSLLVALKG